MLLLCRRAPRVPLLATRQYARQAPSAKSKTGAPSTPRKEEDQIPSPIPRPPLPPTPPDSPPVPISARSIPDVDLLPDEDPLLHYLASMVMNYGGRARARSHITNMLLHVHALTRAPALPIVREAVRLAAPAVRTRSMQHGSKAIIVPVPLGEKERVGFAVEWILKASESRRGKNVGERIAREIVAIIQNKSSVLDKKKDLHKLAMVNRGNALVR